MYKCPNFSYVFFCFVQKLYPFLSCIVVVVYCRSEEGKKFGIIFTENQKIPKRWYFAWWHIRTRVCYNVVGLVGQNLFSRPPLAKQVRTTEAYCYNSISCASSSLKSLILLSEEELTAVASACRKASSDAYFRTYSDTFFLYSSGLCRYMAAASPFRGSVGFG